MTRHFSAKLFLVCAMAMLSACATSKDAITKVKYYHLDTKKNVRSANPSIPFERKHHLYGAVTSKEILAREGHYYTVFWSVIDKTQPVKVKLEYRQANTGAQTHVLEVTPDNTANSNITEFQVTGDAYAINGRVTAWKVSLLRGKEVLSTSQSFLWQ